MELPTNLNTPAERLCWAVRNVGLQPIDVYGPLKIPYETFKADCNGARSISQKRAELYGPKLGVPWQWLLFGFNPRLSPDEMALLDSYRRATRPGREAIRTVARTVPTQQEAPEDEAEAQ